MHRFSREILLPLILVYILILPIVSRYIKIEKIFFGYNFSLKEIIFIWAAQVITVLIFVNLILKNIWGRARPGDVIQLGGDFKGGIYRVYQKNNSFNDFHPAKGSLIISNCTYPHEVTKVVDGKRKSLVFFVSNHYQNNKRYL